MSALTVTPREAMPQEYFAALGLKPTRITFAGGRRAHLCQLFADLHYTTGAEIGVWQGRFSQELCRVNPGLQLIGVDPWHAYTEYRDGKNVQERLEAAYAEATRRLAPYTCRLMRMSSVVAADQIANGSLDFVYIDGNHGKTYVQADLEAWTPKVRSGGIVAGHDYTADPRKSYIHVRPVVDTFTATRGISPVYVLAGDKSPSFFWVVP